MECQPIRAWAGLCSFSPSGYLLAAVIGRKITIQETGSDSEGTLVFLCADNVEVIHVREYLANMMILSMILL